jgi:hypothetical protein
VLATLFFSDASLTVGAGAAPVGIRKADEAPRFWGAIAATTDARFAELPVLDKGLRVELGMAGSSRTPLEAAPLATEVAAFELLPPVPLLFVKFFSVDPRCILLNNVSVNDDTILLDIFFKCVGSLPGDVDLLVVEAPLSFPGAAPFASCSPFNSITRLITSVKLTLDSTYSFLISIISSQNSAKSIFPDESSSIYKDDS